MEIFHMFGVYLRYMRVWDRYVGTKIGEQGPFYTAKLILRGETWSSAER